MNLPCRERTLTAWPTQPLPSRSWWCLEQPPWQRGPANRSPRYFSSLLLQHFLSFPTPRFSRTSSERCTTRELHATPASCFPSRPTSLHMRHWPTPKPNKLLQPAQTALDSPLTSLRMRRWSLTKRMNASRRGRWLGANRSPSLCRCSISRSTDVRAQAFLQIKTTGANTCRAPEWRRYRRRGSRLMQAH